jgi:hypothetical protein
MAYTTIDNPELYFQTKTYTGNSSNDHSITLDGDENMQPDWVWIKHRNGANGHHIYDSVRGVTERIRSDTNAAEATVSATLTSFDSDGFTLGNNNGVNGGYTYVAWNWKAGGSASSNTNGSITSSVSANNTAGFSIVAWTGDGGEGSTVGHGLTSDLDCIIAKERSGTDWWHHWQTGLSGASYNIFWNNQEAERSAYNDGHIKDLPTSQRVFGFDSSTSNVNAVNHNTITNIAYCFSSVKGYSKFGKYTGNGNANGPFVYMGFKPAFLMIKNISSGSTKWTICDSKRDGFNANNHRLFASEDEAESTSNPWEMYSNGFKITTTGSFVNTSGDSYIYMSFAESPFVNSKGVPNNAR